MLEYDGAGRKTAESLWEYTTQRWSSQAEYLGLEVRVTPPTGETPFVTVSDARGNKAALRKHTGSTFASSFEEVTYRYNARDELVKMADAAGNEWRYFYDLAGNRIRTEDPDSGISTATFDSEGRQLTSTNASGQVLATTYDNLDRQTSLRDTSASGPLRAEWSYDTVKTDHPADESRWVAGQKITNRVTQIDTAGRVTKAETVVPQIPGWIDAPLAKTYPVEFTYNADGSPATKLLRNTGNISFEKIQYGYDSIGRPNRMGGIGSYVTETVYGADGSLHQLATGNTLGHRTWSTYRYDTATRELSQSRFDREIVPLADAVVDYTRNPAQQLIKIATSFPQTGATADSQCFTLDHQQRITTAWTPASGNCGVAPSVAGLGGPAPYWSDWTFDAAGNRLSETAHATAGNTVTTWTHPAQGPAAVRPHGPLTQAVTPPGQPTTTTALDSKRNRQPLGDAVRLAVDDEPNGEPGLGESLFADRQHCGECPARFRWFVDHPDIEELHNPAEVPHRFGRPPAIVFNLFHAGATVAGCLIGPQRNAGELMGDGVVKIRGQLTLARPMDLTLAHLLQQPRSMDGFTGGRGNTHQEGPDQGRDQSVTHDGTPPSNVHHGLLDDEKRGREQCNVPASLRHRSRHRNQARILGRTDCDGRDRPVSDGGKRDASNACTQEPARETCCDARQGTYGNTDERVAGADREHHLQGKDASSDRCLKEPGSIARPD